MHLVDDVRRRTFAATHELLADGWSSRQLSRGVARAEIVRVRQGWYALPETASTLIEAFRVGGRLTCTSAARMLGLSVKDSPALHVSVPPHASRLRSRVDHTRRLASGTVVHWSDRGPRHIARSELDVLFDMACCQPPEMTIAAVDSALRLRLITREAWLAACARLPRNLGALLSSVDARADSITESVARVRLYGIGITPRLQVRIAGVGRVDMLIGDRLVVELDGREYHTGAERFEADRRRDALLSIHGYRVLRFSYRQVMHHWSQVAAAITAAIARGDHLA